jgi:ribosomal protein S18 acetylase RimI-like enzyme
VIGTEGICRLEAIGHATWPALEEEIRHGWLLRAAGGATRRANSASPTRPTGGGIDEQLAECEAWYRLRGLPAVFRLTRVADPVIDHGLEARGYARDAGAVIMTRPAAGLGSLAPHVSLAETPSRPWLDLMAREEGRSGTMRSVLVRIFERFQSPARFASIRDAGTVAAIGLGVVTDDHLALYMMQTVPEYRRRGLGTDIAAALAAWGTDAGARHLFLQVHPANAAALAFYTQLDFEPQYEYWYRERPAGRV